MSCSTIIKPEKSAIQLHTVCAQNPEQLRSAFKGLSTCDTQLTLNADTVALENVRSGDLIAGVVQNVTVAFVVYEAIDLSCMSSNASQVATHGSVLVFERCEIENDQASFQIARVYKKGENYIQPRRVTTQEELANYVNDIKEQTTEICNFQANEPGMSAVVKLAINKSLTDSFEKIEGKITVQYLVFHEIYYCVDSPPQFLKTAETQ